MLDFFLFFFGEIQQQHTSVIPQVGYEKDMMYAGLTPTFTW